MGYTKLEPNVTLLEGSPIRSVLLNLIWNSCVPPKACFFGWEAWWGTILTMEQLKKRFFLLASRCPLCGAAEREDKLYADSLSFNAEFVGGPYLQSRLSLSLPVFGQRLVHELE